MHVLVHVPLYVHIVTIADIRSKEPGSFGLNTPEISTV